MLRDDAQDTCRCSASAPRANLGRDRLPAVAGRGVHLRRLPAHRRRGAEREAHLARGRHRRQHRAASTASTSRARPRCCSDELRSGMRSRSPPRTQRGAFTANRAPRVRCIAQGPGSGRGRCSNERAKPLFDKRGQLLPRERVGLLLDPGVPFLDALLRWRAGLQDPRSGGVHSRAAAWSPASAVVAARACMLVAERLRHRRGRAPGAGARETPARAGDRAREQAAFLHLVETAGANLLNYRVEQLHPWWQRFPRPRTPVGRRAAGDRGVHGSATAGGAYMPGLSDA